MSTTVHFDQPVGGRIRRALGYGGAVDVTSPSRASIAVAMFARELIVDAFDGRDPERAQFDLPAREHATILGGLTRRFARHPETTRLIRELLVERDCDPQTTFVGVVRLGVTTGNATAADVWRPHRDTWCGAPGAQLDLWIPVYEVDEDAAMTLYPEYFGRAVANDSAAYHHVGSCRDAPPRPGPTETVDPFGACAFVTPVGGVLQFSGQHLYCGAPTEGDRTRFSVEFETVDVDDIRAGLGARVVDAHCTGSTIRDFVRATDHAPMPEDVAATLDPRRPAVAKA